MSKQLSLREELGRLADLILTGNITWGQILKDHPDTWDKLISTYPMLMHEMDPKMLINEIKNFINWDNDTKNTYLLCITKLPRKYLVDVGNNISDFVIESMNSMAANGALELSLLFRMAVHYDIAPLRARILAAILLDTAGDCIAEGLVDNMAIVDPELFHAIVERYQDQDITTLLTPVVWQGLSQKSRSKIAGKAAALSSTREFTDSHRHLTFKLLLEIDFDANNTSNNTTDSILNTNGLYVYLLKSCAIENRFTYAAEGWVNGKLKLDQLHVEIDIAIKNNKDYMFDGTNIILSNLDNLDESTVNILITNSIKLANSLYTDLFKYYPRILINNLERFIDPVMLGIALLNNSMVNNNITRWDIIKKILECKITLSEYRLIENDVRMGVLQNAEITKNISAKSVCTIIKCDGNMGLQFWRHASPFMQSMVLSAAIQIVGSYPTCSVKMGSGIVRHTVAQLAIFCTTAIRECMPKCIVVRALGTCYLQLGLTDKQYIKIALTSQYEGSSSVYEYVKLMQIPLSKDDNEENDNILTVILSFERRIMGVNLDIENDDNNNEPVRLPWTSAPDWNTFANTILSIRAPVKVVNVTADQPNDIGGPRQQYYGLLGKSISHMFTELDGYLIPRTDLPDKDIHNIGRFLHRCLYIDRVRPDIALHPAVIVRMTMPFFSKIYPWDVIEILLGDWFTLLSPRAKHTKSLAHLAEDIEERYPQYISMIDTLSHNMLFAVPDYAIGVWNIAHGLCGRNIELQKVIKLIATQDNEPLILVMLTGLAPVIERVLSTWSNDRIKSLWKFWFGGYYLDDRDQVTVKVYAAHKNDQMNIARAHTCINQLDIPLPEQYLDKNAGVISPDDEDLCKWIDLMLTRALDTQAIFELANLDYQMA